MLFKIAWQTIKFKWKDLLVLFIGLIISVSIFYMFSTVANNKSFLNGNLLFKSTVLAFIVGEILLGFITFIYLNFANKFLLELRQREYGLLMMFGADKKKISTLLFLENSLVGIISLVIGSLIGFVLTYFTGFTLQKRLNLTLTNWEVFNTKGFLITITFFITLFILNGFMNQIYINRANVNKLLTSNQDSEQIPKNGLKEIMIGMSGIILLIVSFVVMQKMSNSIMFIKLLLSLSLNIVGTFLTIRSGLSLVLMTLQKSRFSSKGLNKFIIGQLTFRLKSFQKILTIVTLLFALSLGALSVGKGLQKSVSNSANTFSGFTLSINNPNKKEINLVRNLNNVDWKASYTYKVNKIKHGQEIIWNANQFDEKPLRYLITTPVSDNRIDDKISFKTANANYLTNNYETNNNITAKRTLRDLVTLTIGDLTRDFNTVSQKQFNSSNSKKQNVLVIAVKDVQENEQVLDKIANSQIKRFNNLTIDEMRGSYGYYKLSKSVFGGLEFMGFFLAVGFLVMLASTLMFKILSNVNTDKKRYEILTMLGATKKQRLSANFIEIGFLFGIPLIIGSIDVIFGLQTFKNILLNVYWGLPFATLIIMSAYVIYYILTIVLYQKMLKNN